MLPVAFNTVADLLAFTSFQQGAGNDQQSVIDGTFEFSQFQTALKQARYEIFRKTLQKANTEFAEDRLEELREAELWLATARLYRNYAERIALKFPESNLSGVATVQVGADTPSPVEKGQHWGDYMYTRIRRQGLELLESPSTRFVCEVSTIAAPTTDCEKYPCLYGVCE